MREITSHKANGLNEALRIEVLDEPGSGNACHKYHITDQSVGGDSGGAVHCHVQFQDGPIKEADINGISNEALLAIVVDRLEGFQSGEFACETNADALNLVAGAMTVLHIRTKERMDRGVEGTHQK